MTSAASTTAASPTRFRHDIEGLRGLAVSLVVLEHAFGQPIAGFIGVDVFFVISGFLITGLLLREWRTTGTISLTAFYARRARRILPVALVTLTVTIGAAFALWTLPRALATLLDGAAGLAFVENWHLIAVGTDYLAADGGTSPLQHFWSLAVEEQFYVFWPVLIVVAGVVAARTSWARSSRARRLGAVSFGTVALVAVAAVAAVAVGSMIYAAWRTDTAPTAAYFDSGARFWELGMGAAAAVVAPRLARCPLRFRRLAVLSGMLVILGSSVGLGPALRPSLGFPWPAAVIPVLGAVLIVGFGGTGTERAGLVLANPVVRWLGRISYSLYLWHVPVIVFAASLGWVSAPAGVVVVALSVGIAALSFRYIELQTRRSGWLSGWERPRPIRHGVQRRRWLRRQVLLGVAVALVVGLATIGQVRGPAPLVDANALAAATGADGREDTDSARPTATEAEAALTDATAGSLTDAVDAAASTTAWPPSLSPTLDQALAGQMAPAMRPGGCRFEVDSTAPTPPCTAGAADADRVALVIGDSIALSWTPAIVEALVPAGWRVEALGFASCPAIEVDVTLGAGDDGFAEACAERRAELQALVETVQPDLLILSSSQRGFGALSRLATGETAAAEWASGTASTLLSLGSHVGRTVVLSNPPRGLSPSTCATRLTGPEACVRTLDDTYGGKNDAEREGAERAAAAGVPVTHVDTREWFCTTDGRCPAHIGRVLLRTDQWHLTETAALAFTSRMRSALGP